MAKLVDTTTGLMPVTTARHRLPPEAKQSPHYWRWITIRHRCFNPEYERYRYYGARGIGMHASWVNDFNQFSVDVEREIGPCPAGHSLDRTNNDGDYEPGNIRWATPKQQTHNSRKVLK